jgi:ubiquinone biosynthesis protein
MKDQVGPRAFAKELRRNWPVWSEQLPMLPVRLYALMQQAEAGKLQFRWDETSLERISRELRRSSQRNFAAIVGSALIVSAALILALDGLAPRMVAGVPTLTWLLGAAGAALILAAWPRD